MHAEETASRDGPAVAPGLHERLEAVPAGPGVYLLKDHQGKVIYVGKAKNLRERVRTYLRGGDERSQVRFLVQRIASFDTLVTSNEKEALILENNLIKQYRPRYNIRLKDDKSYVSVKVTVRDPWPRVLVTRRIVKDGSRYFGPFPSAAAVREALDTVRKVFPLRTCSDPVFRNRSRPCIEYQIHRCLAPCVLPVDRGEYDRHLRQAVLLIEGRSREVIEQLRQRMGAASEALRFEEAARLRDHIRAIEQTSEDQQAVTHGGGDKDVFGLYREGGFVELMVLFVRQGKLTATQAYDLGERELDDAEVLGEVLSQFYQGERPVPDEILLPLPLEDAGVRAELLGERRGRRVAILWPRRGDKLRLVKMAEENARQSLAARRDAARRGARMVEELRLRLRLRRAPQRVECFDISNLGGRLAVGSMVTFSGGEPDRAGYRRFRIRTVEGADDLAMMREVLLRRYGRGGEGGELPDLLVVDGGRGQLAVAVETLAELGLKGKVSAVALAKERVERAPRSSVLGRRPERVFLPGRKNPVVLRPNSGALFLLQRVRDEAHRFAIAYHQKLRARERLASPLDSVAGVGAARRRALLARFGSVKRIAAASQGELASVSGVTPALAARIKEKLSALG